MAGPDPFDTAGNVVPAKALAARRAAGVTDYEREHEALQKLLQSRAMPVSVRLSLPVRKPHVLADVADILHRLASDITAIQAAEGLNDYTRLVEVYYKARDAERRLREL